MSQPLIVDRVAVRLHPLEAGRAVEGPGRAPPHGGVLLRGGDLEDLEREVGEGREQRSEPLLEAGGHAELGEADEPVGRAGNPEVGGGVEIALGDRLEVGAGNGRGAGCAGRCLLGSALRSHRAQRSRPGAGGVRRPRRGSVQSTQTRRPVVDNQDMGVPVFHGRFGERQAETAALASRVRSRPRRGAQARPQGLEARRPLAHPAEGEGEAARAEAARRARPAAGARRRLGARPALVARPHGPQRPAAGRADDARLARLVRDRRRRQGGAQHPPEQDVPAQRAWLLPDVARRRHQGPGDAALALRRRQPQVGAERELRQGDDGAVHARRRQRLHRDRRARAGAGADRLARRLG